MSWANVAGAAISVVGSYAANSASKDNSAQKYAKKRNAVTDQYIKDMVGQSRDDLLGYFGNAQDYANQGYQAGLDVYGQTIPQMFDVFQQGNVAAQNQLLAGLPQIHNAIYGLPIDYSALQPVSLNYDTSFAQQQLPPFVDASQMLSGQSAQRVVPPDPNSPIGNVGDATGNAGYASSGFRRKF